MSGGLGKINLLSGVNIKMLVDSRIPDTLKVYLKYINFKQLKDIYE